MSKSNIVHITITISDRTQEYLVEAVQLKIDKLTNAPTGCLKEKQTEAAKLINKDIELLQTVKNDIAQS